MIRGQSAWVVADAPRLVASHVLLSFVGSAPERDAAGFVVMLRADPHISARSQAQAADLAGGSLNGVGELVDRRPSCVRGHHCACLAVWQRCTVALTVLRSSEQLATRNDAHGPSNVVTTPIWLTMGADTGPFGELSIRQLNWELGSGHARHQGT
jgi:hypothetical protein